MNDTKSLQYIRLCEYINDGWSSTDGDEEDDHPSYVYEMVKSLYCDNIAHVARSLELQKTDLSSKSMDELYDLLCSFACKTNATYIETIEALYIGMNKIRKNTYKKQFLRYNELHQQIRTHYTNTVNAYFDSIKLSYTEWSRDTRVVYEKMVKQSHTLKKLLLTENLSLKEMCEYTRLIKSLRDYYREEIRLVSIPLIHDSFDVARPLMSCILDFTARISYCCREIASLDIDTELVKSLYIRHESSKLTLTLFNKPTQPPRLSDESIGATSHDNNVIVFCIMAKNDSVHYGTLSTVQLLCKAGYLSVYDAMKVRVDSFMCHSTSIRFLRDKQREAVVTLSRTRVYDVAVNVRRAVLPFDRQNSRARKYMTHYNRDALRSFTASTHHYDMIFAIQTCLPYVYIEFNGFGQEKSNNLYKDGANNPNAFIMYFGVENTLLNDDDDHHEHQKSGTYTNMLYELKFAVNHRYGHS